MAESGASSGVGSFESSGPTSTKRDAPKGTRLYLLDALRGLAALGVTIYHIYESRLAEFVDVYLPAFLSSILRHSYLGLDFFFLLSGLVIAFSLLNYPLNPRSVGLFMVRRQLRLDPPYWAVLLLIYLLMFLSSHVIPSHSNLTTYTASDLLFNAFYLQGFFNAPMILVVSWTLCLEVQFYLVFILLVWSAALLKLDRFKQAILFSPLFFWSLAVYWTLLPNPHPALFIGFWRLFYLGVLACWAMHDRRLLGPFLFFWSCLAFPSLWFGDASGIFASAAIILVLLAAFLRLMNRGQTPILQFLGRISYSLYLIHAPIGGRVVNLLLRVSHHPGACVLWFFLALSISIAAAWGLHCLVERPAMEYSRKLKKRNQSVIAGPATPNLILQAPHA